MHNPPSHQQSCQYFTPTYCLIATGPSTAQATQTEAAKQSKGQVSMTGTKAPDAFMPSLNTTSRKGRAELACTCLVLCLHKIISYIMRTETEDSTLKSGVLFTDPLSLIIFFPEFFKTAHSPELKLRNSATNTELQKSHLFQQCQRQVKRAPVDSFSSCRNKINLSRLLLCPFCRKQPSSYLPQKLYQKWAQEKISAAGKSS